MSNQSVDSSENHQRGARDIEETQGQALNFPVIADADRKVSNLYRTVHLEADASIAVLGVVIMDPYKRMHLILTYPTSTGRNFDAISRVIDSLQLTDAHKVATPVNPANGKPGIIVPARCQMSTQMRASLAAGRP
jgi:thioredoxin-dependent peroxiredoxin